MLSPALQLTLGSHILVDINCWYKTEAEEGMPLVLLPLLAFLLCLSTFTHSSGGALGCQMVTDREDQLQTTEICLWLAYFIAMSGRSRHSFLGRSLGEKLERKVPDSTLDSTSKMERY